jgi:hypothetical protein
MSSPQIGRHRKSGSRTTLPRVNPEAVALDLAWENDLVQLLSELESLRVRVADQQAQQRPGPALQSAQALVDRVVGFAQQRLPEADQAQALASIVSRAAELRATIAAATQELAGGVWAALTNFFSKVSAERAEHRRLVRAAAQGAIAVLTSCFELFTDAFQSPEHARQWGQTYGVFVSDLTRVLDRIDG